MAALFQIRQIVSLVLVMAAISAACPQIARPVCCQGQYSFANRCMAVQAGHDAATCTPGTCMMVMESTTTPSCPPGEDESTVLCCSGAQEFDTPCAATAAGYSTSQCATGACNDEPDLGEVASPCEDAPSGPPLCCSGVTYASECVVLAADADLAQCAAGACTPCPNIYAPQCCLDPSTGIPTRFANACLAAQAGFAVGSQCHSGMCPP